MLAIGALLVVILQSEEVAKDSTSPKPQTDLKDEVKTSESERPTSDTEKSEEKKKGVSTTVNDPKFTLDMNDCTRS